MNFVAVPPCGPCEAAAEATEPGVGLGFTTADFPAAPQALFFFDGTALGIAAGFIDGGATRCVVSGGLRILLLFVPLPPRLEAGAAGAFPFRTKLLCSFCFRLVMYDSTRCETKPLGQDSISDSK